MDPVLGISKTARERHIDIGARLGRGRRNTDGYAQHRASRQHGGTKPTNDRMCSRHAYAHLPMVSRPRHSSETFWATDEVGRQRRLLGGEPKLPSASGPFLGTPRATVRSLPMSARGAATSLAQTAPDVDGRAHSDSDPDAGRGDLPRARQGHSHQRLGGDARRPVGHACPSPNPVRAPGTT